MSKKLLTLIPFKIRIKKNINYEVVYVDNFNDPKTLGECRPDTKQIVIKKGESPTDTFKTFIHETLHAINFECEGMNLTEKQVRNLEDEIYRVIKLNKVLDIFLNNS